MWMLEVLGRPLRWEIIIWESLNIVMQLEVMLSNICSTLRKDGDSTILFVVSLILHAYFNKKKIMSFSSLEVYHSS
jgi:hypothetical protein